MADRWGDPDAVARRDSAELIDNHRTLVAEARRQITRLRRLQADLKMIGQMSR